MLRSVFQLARRAKPAKSALHSGGLRVCSPTPGAAFARLPVRSFCADGPNGMDMKSIAALLSALKYGPQAVRKIKAMLWSKSNSSGPWPPGKRVKIAFQEMDSGKAPDTVLWKPESEYFHEVIMRQAGIGDFEVFYTDDGDKVRLDPTKPGIEDFLTDHSHDPSPKLLVEWRPATTWETIQIKVQEAKDWWTGGGDATDKAKKWLTGGGGATDQAVKAAQEKVAKQGGKITMSSSGSEGSLVDHKGYKKADWPEGAKGIALQIGLSEDETAAFQSAGLCEDGKAQLFREDIVGNKRDTQFSAYRIVRRGDRISVIYGKHKESMEVSGGGTSLPSENCIQYNGTLFSAWPPASPHSTIAGEDMKGLTTELPSGWKVVDSSQEGFEGIRQRVIVPYGWHTGVVVTGGADGQLQGWKTGNWSSEAGQQWKPDKMEDWIQKKDGSHFHFNGPHIRLLIQAQPAANHELVNNWKRYVQLSAQREWSQRLSTPPHGGGIEA